MKKLQYFVQYKNRNSNKEEPMWHMELDNGFDTLSELLIALVKDNAEDSDGFEDWEYRIITREVTYKTIIEDFVNQKVLA